MKAMKIDRRENVANVGRDDIELRDQFDFAAGSPRVDPQLARSHNKIFLKHLQRNHTASLAALLGKKLRRDFLLSGVGVIVNVDENVRIEKTTSAHEFRPD
jgi:hypothetical protein